MIAALLMTAAATLTLGQARALERDIVCPASLPTDAARIESMKRFINRYAIFAPASTINERLAFRTAVLAKKKCRAPKNDLNYSFPQS